MKSRSEDKSSALAGQVRDLLGKRALVFVGLMGAGKSVIGKMVANAIGVPFIDSDNEIEEASRMPISDIFASYGETEFRALEGRVISRLLKDGPIVLSTGGGAFINPATRQEIRQKSLSVWLKADLDVLWERVRRRSHRPLLQTENPRETLRNLMEQRYPIYAEANLVVNSRDVAKDVIVGEVIDAILQTKRSYMDAAGAAKDD